MAPKSDFPIGFLLDSFSFFSFFLSFFPVFPQILLSATMGDEDDTIVVPMNNKKTELVLMRLVPLNKALSEDVTLNLSQPARIGRSSGAPNHPNFYGVHSKVVSRAHVDIWAAEGKVSSI